jgi:pimeloyl-ACP methyl ester carboxylesterase
VFWRGRARAEPARRFWSDGGLAALADYGRLYGPGEIDADEIARTSFNLELFSNPGAVMRGMDLLPELASVRCPTLVMAGGVDPVSTVDAAAEIVAALPAHLVRFERFARAGHHIHEDCPDRSFCALARLPDRLAHDDAGPPGAGAAPIAGKGTP